MGTNAMASVLMPVGHVSDYVVQAAHSILQQTYDDFELIVIDDRGLHEQLALQLRALRDPRIRVIPCHGRGIVDALNTGTDAAVGTFWFRCDSDDLYPPYRLAKQIEFLSNHPEFGAVAGSMSAVTSEGMFVADMNCRDVTEEITLHLRNGATRTSLCSWAVRMDLIRKTGGFRRYFATAEDIDMQLRLGERCRVWFDARLSYYYRLHNASTTHSCPSGLLVFYDAAARGFQRERNACGKDALELGRAPEPPPLTASAPKRSPIQDIIIGSAWEHHRNGKKYDAVKTGWRAITYDPFKLAAWRTLMALLIKPAGNARPTLSEDI